MKTIFLTIILFLISLVSYADCAGTSFYNNYKSNLHSDSSNIFIKGVKLENYYYGIRIRIIKNFRTNKLKDTITIWYCNPKQILECNSWDNQNSFNDNDTLICILNPTNLQGNIVRCDSCLGGVDTLNLEKIGDYSLIECYPSILGLKQGKVTGWIYKANVDTTISYSDFVETFINITFIKNPLNSDIKTYPNPIDNILIIDNNDNLNIKRIELYTIQGTLIYNKAVETGDSKIVFETDFLKEVYI